MIPEKMLAVLEHEGVVAIVTKGAQEPHVVNTWNSYINITEQGELLIPVGGMNETEKNIKQNNWVQMTLGSREVAGFQYMGTGFLISGTAAMVCEGEKFDGMKQKFPWARAVLVVKPDSITQTL